MEINNINLIKDFLKFNSEDDFYYLQIIKRKKEHPELGSNNYVVNTYYISSIEHLESKYDEIKLLCNFHNARAYINLNKRSFEKIAFHNLKKITDQIMNKDFKSIRKSYSSVCGLYQNDNEKKWIVDIDEKLPAYILQVEQFINYLEPLEFIDLNSGKTKSKVLNIFPTKNGYHLITTPFNRQEFSKKYPELDVHINNPSILYIP